ncbi:unnamed protein product [Rotaria sp. Silwood1]|nr:unnamed protein product [Rotaria sp. Silwood1]
MAVASAAKKHIMLSYQNETREIVTKIYRLLKGERFRVWMDMEGGITRSVKKDMAYGVDNAICICCFVTPKYQQSQYCEKELSYADSCKVPIIPCYMAEKEWKPTSWLGFIVHDLPRVNFRDANKTNISEKFEELLKKIESVVPQNDLEAAMDLEGNDEDDYDNGGTHSEGEGSNADDENNYNYHNVSDGEVDNAEQDDAVDYGNE